MPVLQIRISSEEKARLQVQAAKTNQTVSAYVKDRLFSNEVPPKPKATILDKAVQALTPPPRMVHNPPPTTKPPKISVPPPPPPRTVHVEFRPAPKPSKKK